MQKIAPLKIKAAGPADNLEEGQFTAYASVFGNLDTYGDVVVKGAFTDSLADWGKSDDVIPLLYGHDMANPDNNIGSILEASEDDHGLLVKAQIDLHGGNGPQVYRLIKGRRLSQMSFAYDVVEGGSAHSEELGDYFELKKLKIYEVSVVPIGANQETELLAVKAAAEHARRFADEVKAGRVLSSKNETTLREAQAQISAAAQQLADVLSAVESANDQEKASTSGPAKDEEPLRAKSEEPSPTVPVDALARQIRMLILRGNQ